MPKNLLILVAVTVATGLLSAQGPDRALLHKPLGESWPSYSGDYSGKRYSSLTQINQTNVKSLTLAWARRLANGPGSGSPRRPGAPPIPGVPDLIIGGEGDITAGGGTVVKGSILQVNEHHRNRQ